MLPVVCAAVLYATAGPPCLPPEAAPLVEAAPDRVGVPLEQEHPAADEPGALVQLTTGGLLYRSDDRPPTFTNGWARLRLGADGEMVEWEGESLDPPPPPPPVPVPPVVAALSGAVGRADCIIGRESHGRDVPNAQGSGAWGPGQYMPGTWARHVALYRQATGYSGPLSLHSLDDVRRVMAFMLATFPTSRGEWSVGGC